MDKLKQLAPVGIAITSFESGNPILTHIFWGETEEQAFETAHSHLFSDYFFSGTLVGGIKWNGKPLKLKYKTKTIGISRVNKDLLENLKFQADDIVELQEELGIADAVDELSKKL